MTGGDGALHGSLALRALLRRRVAVAVLVLFPLVLYVATYDALGRSVRALVFGISWAMSTVAFDRWSRLLPFWSSRELATYAIDGPQQGSLAQGLIHAVVVTVLCAAVVTVGLSGRRRRPWHRSSPQHRARPPR